MEPLVQKSTAGHHKSLDSSSILTVPYGHSSDCRTDHIKTLTRPLCCNALFYLKTFSSTLHPFHIPHGKGHQHTLGFILLTCNTTFGFPEAFDFSPMHDGAILWYFCLHENCSFIIQVEQRMRRNSYGLCL